jgi:hypothetical protein
MCQVPFCAVEVTGSLPTASAKPQGNDRAMRLARNQFLDKDNDLEFRGAVRARMRNAACMMTVHAKRAMHRFEALRISGRA